MFKHSFFLPSSLPSFLVSFLPSFPLSLFQQIFTKYQSYVRHCFRSTGYSSGQLTKISALRQETKLVNTLYSILESDKCYKEK